MIKVIARLGKRYRAFLLPAPEKTFPEVGDKITYKKDRWEVIRVEQIRGPVMLDLVRKDRPKRKQ